jgi:DNA-binding CsgD family transcriptional regulator
LFQKIKKHSELIGLGIALALLLLLLQLLEFRLLVLSHQFEIYVACIAVGFTLLGIWVAKKITRPKTETIIVEKEVFIPDPANFILNEMELSRRKISKRELEVLELMSLGMSNQEIAEKLFVSLNTIKTHSSNLFEKLEVKRRTQAIETAKKLQLIC